MENNEVVSKSALSVKNVMRILSILVLCFAFMPNFLVSCSNDTVNVNAMTAVVGVTAYGDQVVKPQPLMLICLLIPVLFLLLLFLKKFSEASFPDQKKAMIIGIGAVIDLIVWIIFRSGVQKIAAENYCKFKTTGWFTINIISQILIIVLAALVFLSKLRMEDDLKVIFTGGGAKGAINQVSSSVSQMSQAVSQLAGSVATNVSNKLDNNKNKDAIGFCAKCGSPIKYGCEFCTNCGTPVPKSMIEEAEAARKEQAEKEAKEAEQATTNADIEAPEEENQPVTEPAQRVCPKCGAKLDDDSVFCVNCGAKAE